MLVRLLDGGRVEEVEPVFGDDDFVDNLSTNFHTTEKLHMLRTAAVAIQGGGDVTLDQRAATQTVHIALAGFCGTVDARAGSEPGRNSCFIYELVLADHATPHYRFEQGRLIWI